MCEGCSAPKILIQVKLHSDITARCARVADGAQRVDIGFFRTKTTPRDSLASGSTSFQFNENPDERCRLLNWKLSFHRKSVLSDGLSDGVYGCGARALYP